MFPLLVSLKCVSFLFSLAIFFIKLLCFNFSSLIFDYLNLSISIIILVLFSKIAQA